MTSDITANPLMRFLIWLIEKIDHLRGKKETRELKKQAEEYKAYLRSKGFTFEEDEKASVSEN